MNTRKRSADEKLAVQSTDYDYKRCNRCGPCRKKKGLKCETPRKVLRAASTAPNSADGSSMRPPPSQRRNQSSTRNKKAKHSRERCMRCTPCLRKKGDPCANFKARQHEISKDHPDYEMNRKYPLVTLVSSGKYFCDPSFAIPLREEDVAVHMSAEYFMKHPGGEERRAAAAEEAALCWRRAQHEAPEGVRLYNTLSFRWHGFELAPPRPPEGAPPPDDSPPAAAATAAKVTLQLGLTDARSNIWVRYADPQRLTAALAAASGGAPGAGLGRPLGLEVLILTRDGFFLTVRERGGGGGGGGGGGNGGTGREAAPQGLHGVVGQPEPVGAGLVRADLARPSPARLAGASSSAAPPSPSGRGGGGGGGNGAAARELFEAPRRLAAEQTGLPRALLGSPRLLGAAHLTHGPRCGAALLAFLLPTPLSQAQAQRRFQRHAQEQAWRFEQRRQAVWVRARDALRRQRHFRQLRLGAGAEAALGLWRRAEQLRLDKMAAAAPRAAYELPPPDCPEPDMDEDIRPEQALRSRLPGQKVCLAGANGTPKEKSDAEEEGGGGEGGLAGDIDETEAEVARITAQDDVKPGEEATVDADRSGETPSPSSEMGAEKEQEGGNAEPMGNDEDEMEDEEEEDEEQEKLDVDVEDEVESTQQGEEDEEEDDDVDEELLREIEKVAAAEGLDNDEENDEDEDEEMLDEEDEEEEEEEEGSYTGEPANDIIQSKNQGIYSDVEEEEDASVRSAEQEGNGEPTAAEEASGADDLSEEVEDEEVGGYLDEEEEEEEEEAGVSPTEEGDGGEGGYGGESTDGAGSLPPSAQKESAGRRSRVGGNDAASDDEGEEEDDDEEEEDL